MIGAGVHLYIYVYNYMYMTKIKEGLNGTRVADLPFQTLAADLSSNL